jgi:muramoyltetrapeptide carboxypeptidase
MRNLIGTRWEVDTFGRILILEPPEAPYDPELADADLAHLRLAGCLDGLAGLAIGRSDGWSATQLDQFHEAVLDAVRHTAYPVIAGVECTHSAPMMTVPIGCAGQIVGDDLIVTEAAVS